MMISLGYDRDLPNSSFMRLEASYTDYDDVSFRGSNDSDSVSNIIDADVDTTALRISLGKVF